MAMIIGIPGQNPGGSPFPGGDLDDDEPIVDGVEHDNDLSLALVPKIGAALCADLAADDDPEVRAAIAGHDDCDAATRAMLREDPEPTVRAALVRSGHVSPEEFLDDPAPGVLAEVARATEEPSTVALLVGHTNPGVRAGCTASPAVTVSQLRTLATDGDSFVAESAQEACHSRGITLDGAPTGVPDPLDPTVTATFLASEDPRLRLTALTRGVPTPAQVTSRLADEDEGVRAVAASFPHLDALAVSSVASDESGRVRVAVASRRDLSPSLELTMVADEQPAVVNAVLVNGSNPQRLDGVEVSRLLNLGLSDEVNARIVDQLGDSAVDAVSAAPSWSGTLGELVEVYSLLG